MAKILGMQPRTAAIAIGGSALVAGGYLWWRKRQQAAAQPAATVATGCTDASGNAAPCPDSTGVDVQGQLSVIQTELESVLAGQSSSAGSSSDTGSDSGSDSDTSSGKPGPPAGLKVSSPTASGFKASWSAPTTGGKLVSYTYDVETSGKLVKSGPVVGTSVTVTGLKKSTSYTFFVRACNKSGCSAQISATIKTAA